MKESEKEIIKKYLTPDLIDRITELLNSDEFGGICYFYLWETGSSIPRELYDALRNIAEREYGAHPYNRYWWDSNVKVIRIEFLKYIKQQML